MKIRRDVAAIPARSAKETWRVIADLIAGAETVDREQLAAAASIMESLIADELPASVPIVVRGAGPRVVIYCLYNEDAMEAGLEVDPLTVNPTAGEWRVTAPCEADDAAWMNRSLKARARRVSVHDARQQPEDEASSKAALGATLTVDWKALGKS